VTNTFVWIKSIFDAKLKPLVGRVLEEGMLDDYSKKLVIRIAEILDDVTEEYFKIDPSVFQVNPIS
jgi:hypothetical protein